MGKIKQIDFQTLNIVIQNSESWRSVCIKLGLYPDSHNYLRIKERAEEFLIKAPHFLGQAIWRGKRAPTRKPIEYFLVKDCIKISSHCLKKRLIQEGLKKHQCEKCGRVKWNTLYIPLELHHINGDNKDNRLFNIQLLCCNCHAQTSNYGVRNRANVMKEQTSKTENLRL